jgi:hypothetical protein
LKKPPRFEGKLTPLVAHPGAVAQQILADWPPPTLAIAHPRGQVLDQPNGLSVTTWSSQVLTRMGEAEELQIATTRPDGAVRPYVTIWVVRAGDDLYVRSAYGSSNPWFRRAQASGTGRIRAGGIERDVTLVEAPPDAHAAIDAAYHAKYDRYGPEIVSTFVGPQAAAVTLRLLPWSGNARLPSRSKATKATPE